ncbi:hypothetical protein M2164_004233 [Streptomyces sp. SAI-208]|uniref:DUF6286 domain-containing protein n=1 Tax=Streptomyces sp. SAI-208 TaxID=2940550 RepID=UPI002474892B|nr:DUF6286 domain-containing protein [Streptomyces sp. SAI-208]MDH6608598.1 hypothetical protein [Streptomyces sp. SAI-208]
MTAAAQRGTTTVSERAVRRFAERAATEALPGQQGARTAKAAVSVHGRRARVSLGVSLPYPAPLADTVRGLQRHVVARTRYLTGLDVPVAPVRVTSLAVPASAHPPVSGPPDEHPGRTPRRWWSRRRVPVALLTLVAAVACGALAVDLVLVHAAHREAGTWRTSAVHWLSGHGPGDPAVVLAGALTALLGLWTVVLALTPGHRGLSTVHTGSPLLTSAVDRSAVTALVRDAVGDVEGVTAVRVRTGRRRVTVRAGLAFGDRSAAHAAVAAAARGALDSCGLRRPARLRVALVPEPVWRPPAAGTVPPDGPERAAVLGHRRTAGGDV